MSTLPFIGFLRRHLFDRRTAPRLPAQVDAHLLIRPLQPEISQPTRDTGVEVSVEGRTKDLSIGGVGLSVSATGLNLDSIRKKGCLIGVKMTLPTGRVEMEAVPARWNRIKDEGAEAMYVIGAQIVAINDVDRARVAGYLQMLQD